MSEPSRPRTKPWSHTPAASGTGAAGRASTAATDTRRPQPPLGMRPGTCRERPQRLTPISWRQPHGELPPRVAHRSLREAAQGTGPLLGRQGVALGDKSPAARSAAPARDRSRDGRGCLVSRRRAGHRVGDGRIGSAGLPPFPSPKNRGIVTLTDDGPGRTNAPTLPAAHAVDLRKTYGTGQATVHALAGITVTFDRGQFTAVMGPSGSGKSTLMHCMAGLDRPTSGQTFVGDHRHRRAGRRRPHPDASRPDRLRVPVLQPRARP